MEEEKDINSIQKKLIVIEAWKKEIYRGLSIFLILAVAFLFLRIILRLVGANPGSLFAGFVYIISSIFLFPFFGIFPQFQDTPIAGDPAFDASAVIAIFCYIVFVVLAIGITLIVAKMLKTQKQVKETVKESHPVDTQIVSEVVK